VSNLRGINAAFIVFFLTMFGGCRGYQAPVADQGETQVNRPPIIVEGGRDEGQSVVDRSRSATQINSSVSAVPQANRSLQNSGSQTASSNRTSSAGVGASAHTVRGGDTLYSIAYQYDLDFRALAIANSLRAPYTIFVGQQLSLNINDSAVSAGPSLVNSNIGTAVSDNSVARTQGTADRTGGVLRQSISSSRTSPPQWTWPVSGPVIRNFQQGDGKGLDLSGRVGDPVLAASDGDVVYSGRGIQGSGNLIILRHSDRYLSAYAHNRVMLVNEGERVSAGQQIAEVGENTAGTPLLHFDIRLDGKSVDPGKLLPNR
jgi:lipoprotein NlpD